MAETKWANRIVGQGVKPASQFTANPLNWRQHPKPQREALQGVLAEVGWVQQVIENVRTGHLVDGHERIWEALQNGDAEVPYLEVDLSPDEEALILATLDPIGALATADTGKLDELLREVSTGDAAVQRMLAKLAEDTGVVKVDPMAEWQGMPEFEQEDLTAFRSIHVHFNCQEGVDAFAELIGQKLGEKTRAIWYPAAEIGRYADKRYGNES